MLRDPLHERKNLNHINSVRPELRRRTLRGFFQQPARNGITVYISTYAGLKQGPILHGSFAGALGAPPLSPEIREFLKQVRKRPQDFRQLLLTITFHPAPAMSITFVKQRFTFGKLTKYLSDEILVSEASEAEIIDNLKRIRDEFKKRDDRFGQQIEAELQLRNEMTKTTGELITSQILKTNGNLAQNKTLTSFLLEALRTKATYDLPGIGLSFALRMLPPKLVERIRNSEASEAHFTILARLLRRYAEEQQKK